MIKVHVFHTGLVRVDRAIPYKERNPLAKSGLFRGGDKKLSLPVSCYLIEHPEGRILIDTGWNSRLASEKLTRFGGMVDKVSHPIIKSDEGVETHLQKLGLEPSDIDCVYISHLDCDHTSGIEKVRDAKRFMASEQEIAAAAKNPFRYMASDWKMVKIEAFSYADTGVGPEGRSYDAFGDGSVQLVSVPGHSRGLFAVLVRGAENFLVLASDSAYTQRSIDERILPGMTVDNAAAYRALDWLLTLKSKNNCIGIWPNHDPSVNQGMVIL